METEFTTWLSDKMNELNLSMSKLARKSGISHATISQVMSKKQKPTHDFCSAIAQPLGVDELELMWRAGLLRKKPIAITEPSLREILDAVRTLTPDQRRQLLVLVDMLKSGTLIINTEGDHRSSSNHKRSKAKATVHLETE